MASQIAPEEPMRRVLVVDRAKHRHHAEDGIARFGQHLRVRRLCSDRAVGGFFAAVGTA
jgi:hypothetical protein